MGTSTRDIWIAVPGDIHHRPRGILRADPDVHPLNHPEYSEDIIHSPRISDDLNTIRRLHLRDDEIAYIGPTRDISILPNFVKFFPYIISQETSNTRIRPRKETKVIRGDAVARVAYRLKQSGYTPDIIIAHPGWGESLFLNEVWNDTPQLHYVEFAYKTQGSDTDFNDKYRRKNDLQECARTRMKNANVLLNLDSMDWGITPTYFQKSTTPGWASSRISVIHDGIDTNWASPKTNTSVKINRNTTLTSNDEVITFINRTFEPYRGIHIFLKSLCHVLSKRPKAHVILVGEDTPNVSYGEKRSDGIGWLTYLKNEMNETLDWSRIHQMGKVNHELLIDIFRISSAHVYLTYPFVLSWSLLEAMSCGCVIIGSDTIPVREVIKDGYNGILSPFHEPDTLAKNIIAVLTDPSAFMDFKIRARETIIQNYELETCLRKQISLIDLVASGTIVA